MDRTPRFIDIHVVQPIPYANLNRDDTNSVKTMLYGDALRTRISSQSWKRAIREHFQDALGDSALRTRRIGERVAEVLRGRGWDKELADRAGAHVAAGSSIKWEVAKGKDKQPITNKVLTNALVYLPEDAVEELADIAEAHKDAITVDFTGKEKAKDKPESALKGKIDRILIKRNGVINLFGRMLAEIDQADVDGAVQVAHAFTTHTTEVELDYFAAVDDVTAARNDETGSGHMGTAEFSTGTLYRFATVDLKELTKNLSDDSEIAVDAARELAGQFLLSFIESLPQAKKNSTAPHSLPHLAHVAVRSDRPLSFAAAFEEPVRSAQHGGYVARSVEGIDAYSHAANTLLGSGRVLHAAHASLHFDKLEHLGERRPSFEALVAAAVAVALAEAPQ
ncbi:type I-E CRISPR-associated protein Cas7/Cse4/CasC [Streptomyces californicus]|uniref:type I-E CRISPR-associated protein Cas7/Cse4/CasC n=1 Tax=Streptomyces californicus TaxID=67351 RepID=UPI00367CFF6B